jgi:hypothetical protein
MASSVHAKSERTTKPARRVRRTLWSVVLVLALIGIAVVVRRTITLAPILVNGYHPPAPASNPVAAQFAALDDLFARYPVLTLIHCAGLLPGRKVHTWNDAPYACGLDVSRQSLERPV